jgi:hypothetical protein
MRSLGWLMCLSGLSLAAVFIPQARCGEVKFTHEWKGSVDDEDLQKNAPACITSAKGLEKLWKDWKVEGQVPKVDFSKEIVVIATGQGSGLNLSARLDDEGDLALLGMGTLDFVPGFRYVLATVSREGVKTVNKKKLP